MKPIDKPAKEALQSDVYHKQLIEYDKELAKLLDKEWEKDFVKPEMELIKHSSR